jgi:hypothetical protein
VAREEHGMVATIGHISAFPSAHIPSAHNVIPGEARLGLDLCHENDRARERAVGVLRARAVEDPREPWREVALAPAPGKPGDADRYQPLGAARAGRRGSRVPGRAPSEWRWPRRGGRCRDRPDHDAVRPLQRRHQPQSRGVGRVRRRRRGNRCDKPLSCAPRRHPRPLKGWWISPHYREPHFRVLTPHPARV